jgi:hypothetical protein
MPAAARPRIESPRGLVAATRAAPLHADNAPAARAQRPENADGPALSPGRSLRALARIDHMTYVPQNGT